jgi:type I restriction enzyme S subunit
MLTLPEIVGVCGLLTDGDWVESKDQDPSGTLRLTQLADIGDGEFKDRSDRWMNDDQASRLNVTPLVPGDVLIARMPDPLGRACVYPTLLTRAVTVVDVCIVRAPHHNPKWLMHAINAPQTRAQIASFQAGSTRKRISKGNLSTIPLPVPARSEQDSNVAAIEAHFSRLDTAVASLTRSRANVKRARASVLKAAVEGRLVPTEASLAQAKGREYEPASMLLERILAERRAKGATNGRKGNYQEPVAPDTDGLAELPEGWVWTTLGQPFVVEVGATPSRQRLDYWDGTIPWVSSGEVQFCRIKATREAITEDGLRNTSTKVHPKGTVLLGMIGQGRTRGQAAILDIEACNNQNCAAIRVSEAGCIPEYVYGWLYLQYEKTRRLGGGNNQQALNKVRVESIPIPLPPLAEQHRIVAEVDRRLSVLDALDTTINANLARCTRLRQSILKRAFEGRLVAAEDRMPSNVG